MFVVMLCVPQIVMGRVDSIVSHAEGEDTYGNASLVGIPCLSVILLEGRSQE